jgi:hypothetical protein
MLPRRERLEKSERIGGKRRHIYMPMVALGKKTYKNSFLKLQNPLISEKSHEKGYP